MENCILNSEHTKTIFYAISVLLKCIIIMHLNIIFHNLSNISCNSNNVLQFPTTFLRNVVHFNRHISFKQFTKSQKSQLPEERTQTRTKRPFADNVKNI